MDEISHLEHEKEIAKPNIQRNLLLASNSYFLILLSEKSNVITFDVSNYEFS